MMNPVPWLQMTNMISYQGLVRTFLNATAIFCYLLGIAVEVPFMSTAIYTGPVALSFGGADLSWIIGLLVVSPVYYYLSRAKTVKKMAFAKEKI